MIIYAVTEGCHIPAQKILSILTPGHGEAKELELIEDYRALATDILIRTRVKYFFNRVDAEDFMKSIAIETDRMEKKYPALYEITLIGNAKFRFDNIIRVHTPGLMCKITLEEDHNQMFLTKADRDKLLTFIMCNNRSAKLLPEIVPQVINKYHLGFFHKVNVKNKAEAPADTFSNLSL